MRHPNFVNLANKLKHYVLFLRLSLRTGQRAGEKKTTTTTLVSILIPLSKISVCTAVRGDLDDVTFILIGTS